MADTEVMRSPILSNRSSPTKRVTLSENGSCFTPGSDDGRATTTPDYRKPIVKSAVRRWKKLHEQHMMEKLVMMRNNKKENTKTSKEDAMKMARKIPVEVLAKEWMKDNHATVEVRAFLVDKVLPTMILGVEKLLTEVDKRGLSQTVESDPNFNPINYLAQYLLRNNPRYSNFSEASPYVRGLREVSEKLRKQLFTIEDNRLAKVKADARRKREEREKAELRKHQEMERRQAALEKQFLEWNVGKEGRVELALLQSALRSFSEISSQYPEELRALAQFSMDLDPTDPTGRMLYLKDFAQYISLYVTKMPREIFDEFLSHLSKCSVAHMAAMEREQRRLVLTNLFMSCDYSGIGLLDRHRILNLFEQFWDAASEKLKPSLRNPRKWPVVEVDEAEDGASEDDDEELLIDDDVTADEDDNKVDSSNVNEVDMKEVQAAPVDEETFVAEPAADEVKAVENEDNSNRASSPEDNKDSDNVINSTKEDTQVEDKTDEKQDGDKVITSEEKPSDEVSLVNSDEVNGKPDDETEAENKDEIEKEKKDDVTGDIEDNSGKEELSNEKLEVERKETSLPDSMKPDEEAPAPTNDRPEEGSQADQTEDPVSDKEKMTQEYSEKEADDGGEDADLVEVSSDIGFRNVNSDLIPPASNQTGRVSVSFAEGTVYEREKTGVTLGNGSRSLSQASAFDENTLNVSQFVQITETFLGDGPEKDDFGSLIRYVKSGYEETEDEKMNRMLKARQDTIAIKQKRMVDKLFEKWDNDGSGFLDLDEVETVMCKYKEGQEKDCIQKAKDELKKRTKYHDSRLSKREFREFVQLVVDEIPGTDTFDYFVDFLLNSVERSYAERVRGEARKKWFQQIITAGETGGASMEPVYRSIFQALYKDAEAHGGGKRISANVSMLETNILFPEKGDVLLRYAASTPDDAHYLLGKALHKDMKGISFASIEAGKPVHVPRVSNHGNIHFWNTDRSSSDREGSFIVVPLKDRKKRVFGLLGIDTLNDPHSRAIFITHEIHFFQGVAKAFSIAYHHIDIRKKLLRITESAVSWIHRRCPHVQDIAVYMTEPDVKGQDYILRKMMVTDARGNAVILTTPPKLHRIDNLFRDYLFKCVDNSETIMADAYGERHLAFPLRDDAGLAIAVVDISIKGIKKLPGMENREVQRMLKLLQMAHKEITKEFAGEDRHMVLEAEKDEDSRLDIMFDRLMLTDLRENVSKLDARAYAELKSYKEPPKVVHEILKAVMSIFYYDQLEEGEFDDWGTLKTYINNDLHQMLTDYDPTASEKLISPEKVEKYLKNVPHGAVMKHGSLPAQYMYNWVLVCISLIDHTLKMRENNENNGVVASE